MPIDYFPSPGLSEIVIALVGGIGIDHGKIAKIIADRFLKYEYNTNVIRISHHVLPKLVDATSLPLDKFERANILMTLGNKARDVYKDAGVAALGAISEIHKLRTHVDDTYQIGR
ncbi:MAG: hypothetical protein OJI67_14270, partial [Prosthecobacter sp.]|nr:hypothetical protein [Prosthecobacter sp.]